ncbi:MAG: ABC transporter permease [Provencibacterium sp.]|jgi:ABC-2 type transport system permease protein|nr:ABC transporter permease [Provencibacterium sp.]
MSARGGSLRRAGKYGSIFRIRFLNGLQYRAAAAAGIVTQFAWGTMEILIFSAFYQGNADSFPMEMAALSSYIWLQQAFLALFMSWFYEGEIFSLISSGNVAYELCRPLDLYSLWFLRSMALRLSRALLRCAPILLAAVLLPAPYGLALPASPAAFGWFLLSMLLAFLLVVSHTMLVYVLCFFTIDYRGVRMVADSLSEFLSGAVIPLPFLPGPLCALAKWLPYASMQNMPFRIYSGDIAGMELQNGLLLQLFWLAIFYLLGRLLLHRALRRAVVQGG